MNYNLPEMGDKSFEKMVQLISTKVFGLDVIPYDDGPDGGRDATYKGTACYPNPNNAWHGYWVIQAKYKTWQKTEDLKDYRWLCDAIKKEVKNYTDRITKVRIPDNLIFFTNIILTAVSGSGGRDKSEKLIEEIKRDYGIKNIAIIDWTGIDRLLSLYPEIRDDFPFTREIFFHYLSNLESGGANNHDSSVFEGRLPVSEPSPHDKETLLNSAVENLVERCKKISGDSIEFRDMNGLERAIYNTIQTNEKDEIIRIYFFLLHFPLTKVWSSALRAGSLGKRFRNAFIRELKGYDPEIRTTFEYFLLSWGYFASDSVSKPLLKEDLWRLYLEILEESGVAKLFKDLALTFLPIVLERFPDLKDNFPISQILKSESGFLREELFDDFFEIENLGSPIKSLVNIWVIADQASRQTILAAMTDFIARKQINVTPPSSELDLILYETNEEIIFTTFTKYRENTLSLVKEKKLLNDLSLDNQVDLQEVLDLFLVTSSQNNNEINTDLFIKLLDLASGNDGNKLLRQGKDFALRAWAEIAFNPKISSFYSIFAIDSIMKVDIGLFAVEERLPEALFVEKEVRLWGGSIVERLCEVTGGETKDTKVFFGINQLLSIYTIVSEEQREDLLEKLKTIVTSYMGQSPFLTKFYDLLNGEISRIEFENIFSSD